MLTLTTLPTPKRVVGFRSRIGRPERQARRRADYTSKRRRMRAGRDDVIPVDVDMASLEAQLQEDGIAFGTDNPVNVPLEAAMRDALTQAPSDDMGEAGLVVLEQTPPQIADLRDVAQDLLNGTGYDTVVVRTPNAAIAVSDSLSRAAIERGQTAMVAQPDYPQGVVAFAEAAQGHSVAWGIAVGSVVLVLACIAALSAWRARR